MIGEIRHISNNPTSKYRSGTFEEFIKWLTIQVVYQLDIETNVPESGHWCDFELISLQFGSATLNQPRVQWFIQWSELSEEQRAELKYHLENRYQQKLIHNGKFEYIVLRFFGIRITNIFDTMLAEKILNGGMSNGDYALADISYKYLRIIMDKSLQMSFGDNEITDAKILYGVTDVAYLDVIKRLQLQEAIEKTLINVFALEMEALTAFSDITYNGMKLDVEKWRENIRLAEPIIQAAHDKINAWLKHEDFAFFAYDIGYISNSDRCIINFNSNAQKTLLFQHHFRARSVVTDEGLIELPIIGGSTKKIISSYISKAGKYLPLEDLNALLDIRDNGDYKSFQSILIRDHRDWLISQGLLIPSGQATINWNSPVQVLPLMKIVEPKLTGLSEEDINKTKHPALKDLQRYREALKLTGTYGESFIREHLNRDGMVRTNFNQVISTGRVSSSKPNMQNIIVDEGEKPDDVGTRYRNAFVIDVDDDVFVDSDYVAQELTIIAYVSKDPVWADAIIKGYDLHSVCAELVYKGRWKEGAEHDCAYYRMEIGPDGVLVQAKKKCKCKAHKKMRNAIKSINFGLAYGMSEFKLSGMLQISLAEALALIQQYFATFPGIRKALDLFGKFGLQRGYIQTLAPFFRKRWFPYWWENRMYVDQHILGIQTIPALGDIERASMNMPIQGASADIVKVAMILVYNFIYDNNLGDKIKLRAQVHDQITTTCPRSMAEWWKEKLNDLMIEAGKLVIPTGILKADTQITECWTK